MTIPQVDDGDASTRPTVLGAATRVDPKTGVREIAEFFGSGAERLFGFIHLPPDQAEGVLVVCSPLYAEFTRNYRREVLIGRQLAGRGIAVQRFHYRGTGNSDGDPDALMIDSMIEDAALSAQQVIGVAGVKRVAFFGTRMGALVAAAVAREFEGSPLALWDPVVDASDYFREIFRAHRLHALRRGEPNQEPGDGIIQKLETAGRVDVLGYTITHGLYASARDRSLQQEAGDSSRPVLVMELGADRARQRVLEPLIAKWRRSGFTIDRRAVRQREPWWFTSGALVADETLAAPVDETASWVQTALA